MKESPFLNPDPARVFHESELVVGLWDAFPVSPGHALLVPRRQIAGWFEASPEEQAALFEGVAAARSEIEKNHQPDGYNIGINVGAAAGQTIFHLHVHVIPRYHGDVADPRGGVRHVIPEKANYLLDGASLAGEAQSRAWGGGRLVKGQEDPLLPHLLKDLDQAIQVDIAVAFLQPRGVEALYHHLEDLVVQREGRLRLLTGDYLDITHPQALQELLDLSRDPRVRGFVQVRVFETGKAAISFHPKAYLFTDHRQRSTAYVGSSNLSRAALTEGVEWNYRFISAADPGGLTQVRRSFERLFTGPHTIPLTESWLQSYRERRQPLPTRAARPVEILEEPVEKPATPHPIQQQALAALRATREAGNQAGLVVLATGLGKTWLSAFDSVEFQRILFVAHREEILGQALRTFRRIRPGARLGLYTGKEKDPDVDILFASVQTLGKVRHHRTFAPDAFDYIVIDEFHHASAATYRRLIDYFTPRFLLGLTATPERTDGGDLLGLCGENLVFRCNLAAGIQKNLLCPMQYYGVPDEVDYTNIPWRSRRFDEEALTQAVTTQSRAQNALEQHQSRGGRRTVAFCCSQRHADFMAKFFSDHGLKAVSVHSGPESAPRAASLEALEAGELDILCCVDVFNEGVDLPQVDTVMMLRPTESRILWLQQLGRGLRKAERKERLTVIDYIGNHRTFLVKPQTLLLEILGGSKLSDAELSWALKKLQAGELDLPAGCEIVYDLATVDILKGLLKTDSRQDALRLFYEDFAELQNERPTASEAYHEGYNPRTKEHGSWLEFVRKMGGLTPAQKSVYERHRSFLEHLERTQMSRSFKMLLLLAMLNRDSFPGSIKLEDLTQAFASRARRSALLVKDVGDCLDDPKALAQMLKRNPINAWCGGKGTGGQAYFTFDGETFASNLEVDDREAFQELVRELVDWRLAAYLDRPAVQAEGFEVKVNQTGGRPILFPLNRGTQPGIPVGPTQVYVDDQLFIANFVKEAVNVMKRPNANKNELPAILREAFGTDAGQPGTRHRVRFEKVEDGYRMTPMGAAASSGPVTWKRYSREQIPALFGLKFNTGIWNQGFVLVDKVMVLLVTLDKGGLADDFQYSDRFLTPSQFQWQSQNKTTQSGKHGRAIRHHREHEIEVFLFVRKSKKTAGGASPFVCCGQVEFEEWQGEKPITVQWKLSTPVPERLRSEFGLD